MLLGYVTSVPYSGLDALVWNRNDGDKIDGAFAWPLRKCVGDTRDGQTVPDSYCMSNEHVLHEKSIATPAIELRVRRAPWWHDGEETRATCSSARSSGRASEPGWTAEVGFFRLAEDVRFLQGASGNGAVREAGIRVLSLLKDPEVAQGLGHVSLAPGRNQSSQTSMTRDTTATCIFTSH